MTLRTPFAPAVLLLAVAAPGLAQVAAPPPRTASGLDRPIGVQEAAEVRAPEGVFLVKPYLQWGPSPSPSPTEAGSLRWQTDDRDADWAVEVQTAEGGPWRAVEAPASRRVAVPTIRPHRIYESALKGPGEGSAFRYRVVKDGIPVFSARTRARKPAGEPRRVVVFGDCAAGTPEQKAIAYQTFVARPDLVVIAGDVVYSRGRISEYREKFWPVYNAEVASPTTGAPLLRSTMVVAGPGNHDIGTRDLAAYPDGLAYFLNWSQPRNGPFGTVGRPNTPTLEGPEANRKAFLEAAGPAYPRMANFSFDDGETHWTVLDANPYVDWSDATLRDWIERDLAAASGATWRFVTFHQPGFHSSRKHFGEQETRVLAPLFELGRVDLVFNGHVHNYQRSFPLRFAPSPGSAAAAQAGGGSRKVEGEWRLDRAFDGRTRTRPEGVIYLVTGGGGAHLYDPEQQDEPASWQPFTHKFISKVHSFTVVDIDGPRLTVRQVSDRGEELDRFVLDR